MTNLDSIRLRHANLPGKSKDPIAAVDDLATAGALLSAKSASVDGLTLSALVLSLCPCRLSTSPTVLTAEGRFDPVIGHQDLPDLLRPPGGAQPLLGADQVFDFIARPAGDRSRCPAAFLQALHSTLRVARHPFVVCFPADTEISVGNDRVTDRECPAREERCAFAREISSNGSLRIFAFLIRRVFG